MLKIIYIDNCGGDHYHDNDDADDIDNGDTEKWQWWPWSGWSLGWPTTHISNFRPSGRPSYPSAQPTPTMMPMMMMTPIMVRMIYHDEDDDHLKKVEVENMKFESFHFWHDSTLFVIDINQNMFISLFPTPDSRATSILLTCYVFDHSEQGAEWKGGWVKKELRNKSEKGRERKGGWVKISRKKASKPWAGGQIITQSKPWAGGEQIIISQSKGSGATGRGHHISWYWTTG